MSGPYGGDGKRTMWWGEWPECRYCGTLIHPSQIEEHEEECDEQADD